MDLLQKSPTIYNNKAAILKNHRINYKLIDICCCTDAIKLASVGLEIDNSFVPFVA